VSFSLIPTRDRSFAKKSGDPPGGPEVTRADATLQIGKSIAPSAFPTPYPSYSISEFSFLSVCAVVKDQELDLREWVDYHYKMGVNKFYIFDDNSTKPLINFIMDYVRADIVEYRYMSKPKKPNGQLYAYDQCLKYYSYRHR